MKINGKEIDRIAVSSDIRIAYDAIYALKYEYLDDDNVDTDRIERAMAALSRILENIKEV
jgi:hypothetical protein